MWIFLISKDVVVVLRGSLATVKGVAGENANSWFVDAGGGEKKLEDVGAELEGVLGVRVRRRRPLTLS